MQMSFVNGGVNNNYGRGGVKSLFAVKIFAVAPFERLKYDCSLVTATRCFSAIFKD